MSIKRTVITRFQRHVANPIARRRDGQPLLETIGRKSGEPRTTPVSGQLIDGDFWFVSEFGEHSQYIKNIKANPQVRVRNKGQWHSGTAFPVPEDDVQARLRQLPIYVSTAVRTAGTDLLSVRVEFDD